MKFLTNIQIIKIIKIIRIIKNIKVIKFKNKNTIQKTKHC